MNGAFDDRQLDAVLERLDALRAELQQLNRRLDHTEGYLALAHELRSLNESLAGARVRRPWASRAAVLPPPNRLALGSVAPSPSLGAERQ